METKPYPSKFSTTAKNVELREEMVKIHECLNTAKRMLVELERRMMVDD